MKRTLEAAVVLVLAAMLILVVAGCGKKDEGQKAGGEGSIAGKPEAGAPAPPVAPPVPGAPEAQMGGEGQGMPAMPQGMGQGMGQTAAPKEVVVPDTVKKTWPAAKILVKKQGEKDGKVYEVAPGKSISITGSTLRVEVGQYLPDFYMDGQTISSKSEEPNNPTVRLTIFDGDKEIYKGWAFEKYPEAHAFAHPEYSVTLAGGVKAK